MVSLFGMLATALGCGGVAGCSTSPDATGRSSFEVLGPPPALLAPRPAEAVIEETRERIEFVPGHPCQSLATPVYPAQALAAGAGDYVLFVTLTVDETGRVGDVAPSWQRFRSDSPLAEVFFAAAKAAIETWQITPAHQIHYLKVPGGEDQYLHAEAVAQTFEVKFVFEASGRVR